MLTSATSVLAAGDVTRFHAPVTATGLLGADAAEPLYPMQFSAGAVVGYVHNPLVWLYPDGTYDPVIGRQLTLDLTGAVGIIRRVDVGVDLPLTLIQHGFESAGLGSLSGAAIGDLRLLPRLYLLPERSFPVGVAFVPELTFPTGSANRFVGDRGVTFRPRAVASLPLPMVRATGSVAYRLRKNGDAGGVTIGDELEAHLGVEASLAPLSLPLAALMELSINTAAAHPLAGDGLTGIELLAGGRGRMLTAVVVTGGAGVGLTRGLGTPAFRLLLGFAFAPVPPDQDRDGIPDMVDECVTEPEDYDGFADLDGCPERDNDNDGIPDAEDACPNAPEDLDGDQDDDGCPEGRVQDEDRDGLPDDVDQCPADAEDRDGFEDADGCPDLDHDHDGVLDDRDQCPTEKETINGMDDEDGCPDEGIGKTEVVAAVKIEIRDTVLFETGKSTIKDESKPLLNEVSLQILAHPEIKKIRVEGHTDDRGPEEDNLYLSQDRADAVRRYLIGRGVAKQRLEAVGYGETQPIDSNATAAGRTRNRRVEFVIVESN
ncbi:MAG: OmpA family protein [Deltaproteobacteria bacterium]|nr:OmpA family protein [Deltaproteobacteria bacterium]